jgi:hypothetical protein
LPANALPPIAGARPALSARICLLRQHSQQRIAPQLLVIVQILIPQRQPVHALGHQLLHPVLNALRLPMIAETARKLLDDSRPLLHLAQQ